MSAPVAIIIAGALIAATILVTNHWQLSGTLGDAVRLNRWTGDTVACVAVKRDDWISIVCK
jgi:hypothetical protein